MILLKKWTELLLLQLLLFLQRFLYFFSLFLFFPVCYVMCLFADFGASHHTKSTVAAEDTDGVLYVIVSFLMMITSLFLLQRYASLVDKFAFPFWHKIYCCSGGWISFHKANRERILWYGVLYATTLLFVAMAWHWVGLNIWACSLSTSFLMEYYKRHKRNQTVFSPFLLCFCWSSLAWGWSAQKNTHTITLKLDHHIILQRQTNFYSYTQVVMFKCT